MVDSGGTPPEPAAARAELTDAPRRRLGRRGRLFGSEPAASAADTLPPGILVAAAWSWRLLVVGGAVAAGIFLLMQVSLIVIPLLVAVLLSALLSPVVGFLHRHHWPRGLAVAFALVAVLVIVAGLILLVITQVRMESGGLKDQSIAAYNGFRDWLINGPLGLTQTQIDGYVASIGKSAQADSEIFLSGALSIGSSVGHFAAGFLLALFSLLFLLIDGSGIWQWVVRVFPRRARPAIDGAGIAGWTTLGNFVRVQLLVAAIDAVGIGLSAWGLQLPLALPVAVLVFLGSFIPIIGAVLTGALAVFIALIYKGWVIALIMVGFVLLVQEIEGHVLQPLIMGRAVKVHPLAVVLAVTAGGLVAGIPGALFAVPLVAVLNVMITYIAGGTWRTQPPEDYIPPGPTVWRTVPTSRRPQIGKRS